MVGFRGLKNWLTLSTVLLGLLVGVPLQSSASSDTETKTVQSDQAPDDKSVSNKKSDASEAGGQDEEAGEDVEVDTRSAINPEDPYQAPSGVKIQSSWHANKEHIDTISGAADFLWGFTPSNGIGLGMWSYHIFYDNPFEVNWQTQLLAVNYDTFYVATIVNTFWDRGFTVGVRRDLYRYQNGPWNFEAGYNLGVLSGYTGGHGSFLSAHSPVIPFLQGFVDVTYNKVGIEFAVVPPAQIVSLAVRVIF